MSALNCYGAEMAPSDQVAPPSFHRIDAGELKRRLDEKPTPLILDVRRGGAFEQPGVPTALPFALDRDPILLPDVSRGRSIVAYCL